ncbi:Forkhead box protein J3 [Phlyctochytrium bullatum]|nr:Forkhead box protein J3 [Phlyctochytrium bullatum]
MLSATHRPLDASQHETEVDDSKPSCLKRMISHETLIKANAYSSRAMRGARGSADLSTHGNEQYPASLFVTSSSPMKNHPDQYSRNASAHFGETVSDADVYRSRVTPVSDYPAYGASGRSMSILQTPDSDGLMEYGGPSIPAHLRMTASKSPSMEAENDEADDPDFRKDEYDGSEQKATKSVKRHRRVGENGESKDPKYVLTSEEVEYKGISYADLITYAIAQSPHKKLKLQAIYTFLTTTFGYFKHHTGKRGWENSIRHNLSMKSRGRFLKVKEEDDSEKGSYWHLNPDPKFYAETIENAHETADKLENWIGILYYPARSGEELPPTPFLFSEEDRQYTDRMCVIDEFGSCIKFKGMPLDSCNRRKTATTANGMPVSRVDLPLPPPPYKNLISCPPVDLNASLHYPSSKAERKRKRDEACREEAVSNEIQSRAGLEYPKRSKAHNLTPIETNVKHSQFGGLVMAYPTPLDDLEWANHLQMGVYGELPDQMLSFETQNMAAALGSPGLNHYDVSEDQIRHQMLNMDVNGLNGFYETQASAFDAAPYQWLFNDDDEVTLGVYASSLLFGGTQYQPDFAIPVVDVSSLDLDRLIADPTVPIDNSLALYNF